MSELQRRWAKAKMDALAAGRFDERDEDEAADEDGRTAQLQPQTSPASSTLASTMASNSSSTSSNSGGGTGMYGSDPVDDDAASLSSASSSASSTGTVVPSASHNLFARPHGLPRGRTLDPIPWTTFFERELFLAADDGSDIVYHAYLTSPVDKGPLFVMHHGAGSSGLSFAVVGAEIRKRLPSAGILSVDARDHGLTRMRREADEDGGPQPDLDLRLCTLSADLLAVIRLAQAQMRWPALPPIVLVGHSLGGAVVTDLAHAGTLGAPLLGFAVLDVVEGSAMDALQSMRTYLASRPAGFPTLQSGIEWHIRSRTIRNATSARTSVPALLVHDQEPAGGETPQTPQTMSQPPPKLPLSPEAKRRPWHWRTDLAATQPFWEDWFTGLSKKFLGSRGGKLLLLAGTDRLDTELTIGQMQGKYALQVFPEAGHFIHEDLPEKTAMTLVDFYRRNDRTALVLPPKVSEMLAQGRKV
ncbi:ribosomal protein carboxylic ester hydrolase [Grosmannia clavigera kw1407]|uniref:Protein phosphatase methylesterase 1 n=1 Tax=Grosmannia clavigera (strain kw1407 / UAMH 11150) TaxID=655863 RepID=F0X9D5_GROCL|nr:ribosomal protein carboxylic ester hydrolase [Grosmannia clavigera kw1407]EFX05696.1 ribosomal protein carboxylic ester hydrolase [Grosmannia clavigera kw1407]